jgi:hypothetical protein
MLPHNPSSFSQRLDDVLECCITSGASVQAQWLDIVRQIAEENPEVFVTKHVGQLKSCTADKYAASVVFGIFLTMAKVQPELLRPQEPWMLEMCTSKPDLIPGIMKIIPLLSDGQTVGLFSANHWTFYQDSHFQNSMAHTVNQLMPLVETLKPSEKVLVLTCIRSLSLQDKAVIQPHTAVFEQLRENRECAEIAQQLLDISSGQT